MTFKKQVRIPRIVSVRLLQIIGVVGLLLASVDHATWVRAEGTPPSDAPRPVTFPRDDGPHDQPIEWWYYTGHLDGANVEHVGFEFVVFKGKRGEVTGYASHFAITDARAGVFQYDQRLGFAPAGANDERETGFDLQVLDWSMTGVGGEDTIRAAMEGYAIDLALSASKPPALHDGDGYIDYGGGEGSYYYSRPRMQVTGTLTVNDASVAVTGEAWFDHQWGDFSTINRGGWDWYSFQFDDNSEVMLYVVRESDNQASIIDGSLIAPDGTLTTLDGSDFTITPTGSWISPHSGAVYPSGWEIAIPGHDLAFSVTPVMLDQELDTVASTGVVYWEGEVRVAGTRDGSAIAGLGYVELTGYVPVVEIAATPVGG